MAVLALVGSASGAIITTNTVDVAPGGPAPETPYTPPSPAFNPSSTDLLTGRPFTLVQDNINTPATNPGLWTRESAGGAGVLNNGSITTQYPVNGPGDDADDHAAYATLGENELIIWDLGGTFNITEVVVYGGWNDGGRDQTFFGLDVSSDGITFTQIAVGNSNTAGTTPISHRISVTNDAGAFIATGITHIRLDPGTVENGYTGYTEVDVFGTNVPEPTSIALLGLGAIGLFAVRRR